MDERVSLAFERLRRALGAGLSAEAAGALAGLERSVADALSDLDSQARAVADANARAVEMNAELELQSRATAEATVDAVLEAEASQERVSELEQEAAALAVANADAVVLVLERETSLEEMATTTQRVEKERDALQERVFVDELTGLFNHRYFREQIRFEHARARRYERPLSLIFVDLDLFKQVNDTYGHVAGDGVLREVADLVRAQLRTSDIPVRVGREPVPIRYGGEELVVILPETDLGGATAIAERIRVAAESHACPASGLDISISITLSAGVACIGPQDTEAWDVVRRADEALYRAKAAGRNRVEVAG